MSDLARGLESPTTTIAQPVLRAREGGPELRDVAGSRSVLLGVVATVGFIVCGFQESAYVLTVATTVCILAILSLGLDLILGFTGMFSFGQAAFMGVGAYVTANLLLHTGMPFIAVLLLAMGAAGLAGVPVGLMATRVQGDYFALVTLGFGQIAYLVFSNWTDATGGQTGLPGLPIVSVLGWQIMTAKDVFLFTGALTILVFLVCAVGVRGRFGRAMSAVREDGIVAASQGIRAGRVRVVVFALGSALAGLAGALQAMQLSFVGATNFELGMAVLAVEVVVIGGAGTVWGALYGALVLTLLTEIFRPVADYRVAIFGALLLIVLVVFPGGLVSIFDKVIARVLWWFKVPMPRPVGAGDRDDAPPRAASAPSSSGHEAGPRGSSPTQPVLEARDVEKSFGGVMAVNRMSITVNPAEILVVMGPNGSGKTTLLNVLSGVLRPTSGTLAVDGRDVPFVPSVKVARDLHFNRTFQNIRLCESLTVLDNVLIGAHTCAHGTPANRRSIERDARYYLDLLRLQDVERVAVGGLSYGVQRRVEIARALMLGPRLLMLDEPSAGMNPAESQDLKDVFATLRDEGIALLIVEHNMRLVADVADRVVVMDAGALLAEGTPQDVVLDPAVRTAYLGS